MSIFSKLDFSRSIECSTKMSNTGSYLQMRSGIEPWDSHLLFSAIFYSKKMLIRITKKITLNRGMFTCIGLSNLNFYHEKRSRIEPWNNHFRVHVTFYNDCIYNRMWFWQQDANSGDKISSFDDNILILIAPITKADSE